MQTVAERSEEAWAGCLGRNCSLPTGEWLWKEPLGSVEAGKTHTLPASRQNRRLFVWRLLRRVGPSAGRKRAEPGRSAAVEAQGAEREQAEEHSFSVLCCVVLVSVWCGMASVVARELMCSCS